MRRKLIIFLAISVIALLTLSGCIPGDGNATADNPAGFFWGIWHGWVAPVSLIIGIFNRDIRLYETANTGWFYDLGFYIAVISGFGGLAFSRKKSSS